MKIAVTGGTGFIGSRLLDRAIDGSQEFRALARRAMRPRRGVTWIDGALDRPDSLNALVQGSDAVIHIAGLLNGRTKAQFDAVNVDGTAAVVKAAREAGIRRFVHVSSLAARHPEISLYGASKAESEKLVEQSGLDHSIVRPPAVYGPGDRETLDLFRMAKYRFALLPSDGRLSLIHVDDLVRLLLALAQPNTPSSLIVEPDDGLPLTQREFAHKLGEAFNHRILAIQVPSFVLRTGAAIDGLIRRGRATLTPDRAAYFAHDNWAVDPRRAVPPSVWKPSIGADQGLRDTADWYRNQGWL